MKAGINKGMGVAAALDLARRRGGVTAAEVREALGCHDIYSHQVLTVLMARHGCVRTKGNLKAYRYFGNQVDLQAWLKHQLNVVVAHIVIGRRPKTAAVKPAPARSAKTARPAPPTPEPLITAQTKVTRYVPPPPKPGRLDLITRAPGVPGWGGGPVMRDGAMDFKRHQQPASHAFPGGLS